MTATEAPRCRSVHFLNMESFTAHITDADLLILHAGAGIVINAIQAGKFPVVAPRRSCFGEHVDDHQLEVARALAAAGKVVVLEDMDQLAAAVGKARARQSQKISPFAPPPLVAMVGSVLTEYAKVLER